MTALLLLCMSVTGCRKAPAENRLDAVMLTGIDHLPDHVSVQHFTVNGTDGFQAGKGGSDICCARLPLHWTPGLTVKVTWNVTNWRDCTGENREAVVPVAQYDYPAHIYVHFMRDGTVRVVSTDKGYWPPGYPDPDNDIPQKEPWDVWPPMKHCPNWFPNPHMHEM
ncbi:DUF3304 domain-containing protein [Paraburkholderia tropica]|uniref:DUF3304 domain-containing protein n=1 Tax=Paraburkholderia tropica TaxID=92647 RepID=UPI001CC82B3A|nr:DUF3304 domain-containing protein [Paraburkholderia tropica]